MKSLVRSLGITAILLGAAPALAGQTQAPAADGVKGAELAFSVPTFFKDDNDSTEGDEDTGVVDPVPQDDGTPGVDDPATC